MLVVYAVRGVRILSAAAATRFIVDGSALMLAADAGVLTAVTFARLYRHGGGWKLRALSEGTMRGLADLGRLHGVTIDEGVEPTPLPPLPPPSDETLANASSWTGTGFLVAPRLMVTNAHVVDGACILVATGYDGRTNVEPIIIDTNCDLALVRLQTQVAGAPLYFRASHGPSLGETAITLGYPLAGFLGSGPQVANGSVSGLLGPSEDTRILQITTPIQGGSSGGPVLDTRGRVIGVVTASLQGAQNVNFAVRGCLAQALVEAAGCIPLLAGDDGPETDVAGVARMARGAVWRLEARR
ncbi:trypsin-like peptidase domain-containing protein [Methylobacterium sp. 37f]|nr:trypsin-like peptidase domain-containing protein [Methylobacterium sp. 37f]